MSKNMSSITRIDDIARKLKEMEDLVQEVDDMAKLFPERERAFMALKGQYTSKLLSLELWVRNTYRDVVEKHAENLYDMEVYYSERGRQ